MQPPQAVARGIIVCLAEALDVSAVCDRAL
jgi:hypothetical protein